MNTADQILAELIVGALMVTCVGCACALLITVVVRYVRRGRSRTR